MDKVVCAANPYYVHDERTDKEKFIAFWAPSSSVKDAEEKWEIKCSQNVRQPSMVMGDIAPYKSQIDGSMIESRSQHRSHLKQHNCIEIGNETKHLKPHVQKPPPGLKEELIRAVNDKLQSKRY